MNLDELRSVQSKERRKDSLQQLRDSFYQDVAAYIQDLRAERDRRAEQVDNPFSDDEVRQRSDKLDTAEEVAEALYERRVGKVVKLASFAAADMSASEKGMTIEEQELFDDLVARIKQNKTSVLDVLAGEQTDDISPPTDTADSPVSTPTESTPPTEPSATPPATADDDPTTVGGANAHGAEPHPTPPEADAEADDVLASAMGEATDANPGAEKRPVAAEPPNDPEYAGDSDAATGDDGVPTPDGGSTVPSEQHNDTSPTQPSSPSPAPPRSDESSTPQPEPAATESPSTDSPPTESSAAGTTATTAMPQSDVAAEPTVNGSTAQQSARAEADATTESVATAADTTPRTLVRITDDVGTIFGVDEREYTLQAGDVVTLPTTNAEVLLKQDAATKLN